MLKDKFMSWEWPMLMERLKVWEWPRLKEEYMDWERTLVTGSGPC